MVIKFQPLVMRPGSFLACPSLVKTSELHDDIAEMSAREREGENCKDFIASRASSDTEKLARGDEKDPPVL